MCGYSGCKNDAVWKVSQLVGKKQELRVCQKCAPKWVKTGEISWLEKTTGIKSYNVERIKK